jgi:hypothetical protein
MLLLLACSDREDIGALQTLLKNPVHAQIFLKLKNSPDFQKAGFDNIVAVGQLTPLRRNTQIYLKFLDKFEPKHSSTRKMHQSLKQPLANYDRELGEMAERLKAYRAIKLQIDSLNTGGNPAVLAPLDQKEQHLHRSLTNGFLINRTTALLNEINLQLEMIYQK